ncbi:MAG: M15 family metallopeptidase [Myxococcota bacterium]
MTFAISILLNACDLKTPSPTANSVIVEPAVEKEVPTMSAEVPQTESEPEVVSLMYRLENPAVNHIVMEKPTDEQQCVAMYENCECFKSDLEWLCYPKFHSKIRSISPKLQTEMEGSSWEADCPVGPADLKHVHVLHWSSANEVRWGELIVATDTAELMVAVFKEIYYDRFLIPSMRRIDHFDASDDLSMAANNTSAFNCRKIKGTEVWSQHTYGNAIDINPLWNPWVRGTKVDPPAAEPFVDRAVTKPGMIQAEDVVVAAFKSHGWQWGGDWTGKKDYQHFSVNGR